MNFQNNPEEFMSAFYDLMTEEESHLQLSASCSITGCSVNTSLKLCSKCKLRHYCSINHQKQDWNRHKVFCHSPFKDQYPSEPIIIHSLPVSDTDAVSIRYGLTVKIVDELWPCLLSGAESYPPQHLERVFGIEMSDRGGLIDHYTQGPRPRVTWGSGCLTYHAWCYLLRCVTGWADVNGDSGTLPSPESGDLNTNILKNDQSTTEPSLIKDEETLKKEVINAMMQGTLRKYFITTCDNYLTLSSSSSTNTGPDIYASELQRRGYLGIPWDWEMLSQLAGKNVIP